MGKQLYDELMNKIAEIDNEIERIEERKKHSGPKEKIELDEKEQGLQDWKHNLQKQASTALRDPD